MQTHQPKEDKIASSLDITPVLPEEKTLVEATIPDKFVDKNLEYSKDLEYSRENLYYLIERGRDALDGILSLADQSQSPRAYEVVGQLIKTVTDTNRDLIDLQKKAQDLSSKGQDPRTVTNNLFVGSTAELTKLIGGDARNITKARNHGPSK